MENSQEKKQITEKYFLDTNTLAYLISNEDIEKHKKIKDFIKNKNLFISIQNLKELSNILFKKTNLNNKAIEKIILNIGRKFNLLLEQPEDIVYAIQKNENKNNFYDCLLIATMIRNNIKVIVTENEKDFSNFENIKVINPFK